MALKNGFFSLALSALVLAPLAAMADGPNWGDEHPASPIAVGEPAPGRAPYRSPPPPPPPAHHDRDPGRHGRYELQTVHTQVPGRYENVWVAEQCYSGRRHMRCEPGHYEQRWMPGYTQTSQQWVWVPYGYGYGRGPRGYGRG